MEAISVYLIWGIPPLSRDSISQFHQETEKKSCNPVNPV